MLRTREVGFFDQTNVEMVDEDEAKAIMVTYKALTTAHNRNSIRSVIVAIDLELDLLREAINSGKGPAPLQPSSQRPTSAPLTPTLTLSPTAATPAAPVAAAEKPRPTVAPRPDGLTSSVSAYSLNDLSSPDPSSPVTTRVSFSNSGSGSPKIAPAAAPADPKDSDARRSTPTTPNEAAAPQTTPSSLHERSKSTTPTSFTRPSEPLPALPTRPTESLPTPPAAATTPSPPPLPQIEFQRQRAATAPAPSGPLPSIPPQGLNSTRMAATSEEEEDAPQRPRRNVTFSENLVTVIDQERLNERAAYLVEKREELYEQLMHLPEDVDPGLADRRRKRTSFLVEERMMTDINKLRDGDLGGKKKRTVWSLISRKKSSEDKKPADNKKVADDKKQALTGKKSKLPLIIA